MYRYRLYPYKLKNSIGLKGWDIQLNSWLGWKTIYSYSASEWQTAKDHLVQLGKKNRPACITTHHANGEKSFHWDTKKA